MQKLLLAIALVGLSFSSGNLFGENATGMFASSTVTQVSSAVGEAGNGTILSDEKESNYLSEEGSTALLGEEEASQAEEVLLNDPEETVYAEIVPEEEVDEAETETEKIESDLTYDQMNQRDVGEVDEEPPSPEVIQSWYDEETAEKGREMVLAAYDLPDFSFVIDSCPSNYVYQYEFYADSPEGDHVNLIGIFQYDATGHRTFHLNPITGVWE